MIKSILVPIGTSEVSRYSLKTSVYLANLFKAHLYVLYVEDTAKIESVITSSRAPGPGTTAGVEGLLVEEVKKDIGKEKEIARKYYEEVKDDLKVKHKFIEKEGYVIEEVLKASKAVDLIVLGKKSLKKDIQHSLSNILQKSSKPVLTVNNTDGLGENMLIAYDGSRTANNILKVIGDFVYPLSPKVTVITINSNEEKAMTALQEAEQYLLPYEVEIEKIWKTGSVSENIIKTVEEKNISFVAMGGYGDNKFKEFFLGSTTKKVFQALDIPIIVANV